MYGHKVLYNARFNQIRNENVQMYPQEEKEEKNHCDTHWTLKKTKQNSSFGI